jgi:hypothetical protein
METPRARSGLCGLRVRGDGIARSPFRHAVEPPLWCQSPQASPAGERSISGVAEDHQYRTLLGRRAASVPRASMPRQGMTTGWAPYPMSEQPSTSFDPSILPQDRWGTPTRPRSPNRLTTRRADPGAERRSPSRNEFTRRSTLLDTSSDIGPSGGPRRHRGRRPGHSVRPAGGRRSGTTGGRAGRRGGSAASRRAKPPCGSPGHDTGGSRADDAGRDL